MQELQVQVVVKQESLTEISAVWSHEIHLKNRKFMKIEIYAGILINHSWLLSYTASDVLLDDIQRRKRLTG